MQSDLFLNQLNFKNGQHYIYYADIKMKFNEYKLKHYRKKLASFYRVLPEYF